MVGVRIPSGTFMLVTALHSTWLKPSRADSSTIPKSDMHLLEEGATYTVRAVGQLIDGHYLLTLDEPLQGYREWYVYAAHVRIDGMPKTVNLPVPYHPQYDNAYQPNTSCFATSVSMALAYYGVKPKDAGVALEDELYLFIQDNGLDRFSWQDIAWVVGKYGCKATITTSGTFADIKAALDSGCPVILGTMLTHAGHIILVRGYDADGLICNDPWGLALGGGSYDLQQDGDGVHYSWSMLAADASEQGVSDPTDLWIMTVEASA